MEQDLRTPSTEEHSLMPCVYCPQELHTAKICDAEQQKQYDEVTKKYFVR